MFSTCTTEQVNPENVELGYDYYPLQTGRFWEYEVIKTTYSLDFNKEIDTFYTREVISSVTFEFDEDLKQIERYKKSDLSDEWVLDSLWTTKRTPNNAQRTEQNVTHVKMTFPIQDGKQWNGNAYNIYDSEKYTYEGLYEAFSISNDYTFDESVHVMIGPNLPPNLIETDQRYEVYAKNIGNVYRYSNVLSHQPPSFDTVGVRKVTKLISYGQ